ncbi:ATP-binding cassette domain-containing protein [Candidatus Parcubacteria bacterium]|nr:ATP-binding cassette domain-containing protein [Candidatus Parcubacteria bacterium]
MESLIKANNLNFTYNRGKDNEYQSLINVSFDIYPEEFIIIFGPSGCGKSTLLNVIAGLEKPDTGSMVVSGHDISTMSKHDFAMYHRSQVGMIYQQYNLIVSLSVLDNVVLPQLFINISKGKRNKWGRQLLERFGILKQAKKNPTELSGGQMQRIGIARSIVNNPKIILADEPVGNLDSVSAKNVLDILGELNEKEKKTIILVTHNPEYLTHGDRIFYMKDGIITREVINRDKKKKDKSELAPKSPTAEINDLMRAYHGLTPEQINILIMPYKAKAFAHHFISSRNMEETKILEDVIQRRLLGTISQEEFFGILRKNSMENGVGFDVRTAEKILRRVNRIIRTAYYIYQEERKRKDEQGKHEKLNDGEKAKKATWYLLGACYYKYYKNLDEAQINRLRQAVKDRLVGVLQKNGFFKQLDKSFKTGGVGLNSKTAKAMTEELELILILGFGIVQKISMDEIKAAAKPEDKEDPKSSSRLSAVEKNIAAQQNKPATPSAEAPTGAKALEDKTADKTADKESSSAKASTDAKALADKLADKEGIAKDNKLYLSGEEAARLAQAGAAFDTVEKAVSAATGKSEELEKEIKEAEDLAVESEKALNRISPEVTKFISDVAEEYEKDQNNDNNGSNKE